MTRATELTDAVELVLGEIAPAAGYHTDIKAVYGVAEVKPDKALLPCILVRIASDGSESRVGPTAKRQIDYEIEGVFSRAASLQDLQRCHHDILRALGFGTDLPNRPLKPGWVGEESAEFDMATEGGTNRTVKVLVQLEYVEKY